MWLEIWFTDPLYQKKGTDTTKKKKHPGPKIPLTASPLLSMDSTEREYDREEK